MAIEFFTLNVDVSQIVGTPVKRARIHVATNLPEGTPIAYGSQSRIFVPGGIYEMPGGVGSIELPTKVGATNVSDWQYVVTIEAQLDGVRPPQIDPIYINAPSSSAANNLVNFVGVTSVPATFMGAAIAQITAAGSAALADTTAARAAAQSAAAASQAAATTASQRRDQAAASAVAAQAAAGTAATQAAAQAAAGVAAATAADRTAVAADRAFVEARAVDDLGTTDGQTRALIETPSSETAKSLKATVATGAEAVTEAAESARIVSDRMGLFVREVDRGHLFRAFHPTTGDMIAVTTQSVGGRKLARSADSGETWTLLGEPGATNTAAYVWFSSSGTWFAWSSGLRRSTDQGVTWSLVLSGIQAPLDEGFTQTPDGNLWLAEYMGTAKVFRSADDGATWTEVYNWPNSDAGDTNPVIRHAHGIKSLPSGLWAYTGDNNSECGLWRWEGGTFVRKSPAQTDPQGAQRWRTVGLTERAGWLYWVQDGASAAGAPPGIFKAHPSDLAGTVTRLATLPSGGWYTAQLPTGEILLGSVTEALGLERDQDARLWLVTNDDKVMEVWRANRATTNLAADFTAVRNLRVRPTDGLVAFTANQLDFTGGGAFTYVTVSGHVKVTPERPPAMSRETTPRAYRDTVRAWTVRGTGGSASVMSADYQTIPGLVLRFNSRNARPVQVSLSMDVRSNTDGAYVNVRLAAYNADTGVGPVIFGPDFLSYGSVRNGPLTISGLFAPAAPGLWEIRGQWSTNGTSTGESRFNLRVLDAVEAP